MKQSDTPFDQYIDSAAWVFADRFLAKNQFVKERNDRKVIAPPKLRRTTLSYFSRLKQTMYMYVYNVYGDPTCVVSHIRYYAKLMLETRLQAYTVALSTADISLQGEFPSAEYTCRDAARTKKCIAVIISPFFSTM